MLAERKHVIEALAGDRGIGRPGDPAASACRYLVKDRMGIAGARWGIQTAKAIVQLRALQANGDLDA